MTFRGLATVAAFYENQPGREWRALQDTDNHNLLGYRVPGQWASWMRGTGDYYREAQLIFIRERPWMPMAHSAVYIPVRKDVKGFVMAPNGSVDFEGVWRE